MSTQETGFCVYCDEHIVNDPEHEDWPNEWVHVLSGLRTCELQAEPI